MSTPTPDDYQLAELRAVVRDALARLYDAVRAQCPGPHRPVQHRDNKPAWCKHCGRTEDGRLVKA